MTNDIASELAKLHELTGAEFSRQVERIANMHIFHPINGEEFIYGIGGEMGRDYLNQLRAARKLVVLGYKVFLLPNPNSVRTPDFIVERKGIYRIYDLKTITGESSVINRLKESIGQCNHIVLNLATNYDSRKLSSDIKQYFSMNPNAAEVMVFKGGRQIVVKRNFALNPNFIRDFMMRYNKRKSR